MSSVKRNSLVPEKIFFTDPFKDSSGPREVSTGDSSEHLEVEVPSGTASPRRVSFSPLVDQRRNRFERPWRRPSTPRSIPTHDFILFEDNDMVDLDDWEMETNVSMGNIFASPAARCALYPRLDSLDNTMGLHPNSCLSADSVVVNKNFDPNLYSYARRRSSLPERIFRLSLSNPSTKALKRYIHSPINPSSRKPSLMVSSSRRPTAATIAADLRKSRESTDWQIDPFGDYRTSISAAASRSSVSRLSISRFIEPETTKGETGLEAFCKNQAGADAYPLRLYRSMIFGSNAMMADVDISDDEKAASESHIQRPSIVVMDTASC